VNTFLVLLLVAAMIATVVALVRGVVNFMRNADAEVRGAAGPSEASIRSNKLMQARIFFQAIAVLIIVLILFAAGRT
jgi:hypothetical protein